MKVSDLLDDQKLLKIVTKIDELCQPYLEEISYTPKHYTLYRGMKTPPDFVNIYTVKKDRRPLAVSADVFSNIRHELSENFFKSQFNIAARTGSIFATSSEKQAKNYGEPTVIFPIGEFKYIWSNQVGDLYGAFKPLQLDDITKLYKNGKKEEAQQYMNTILSSFDYQTSELKEAMFQQVEIAIECDQYIAINNRVYDQILKSRLFDDIL